MSIESLKQEYPWPERHCNATPCLTGWYGTACDRFFREHLNSDTKIIVEIGSYQGLSASHYLQLAPNATIVCIDTWKGSDGWEKWDSTAVLYETFLANFWFVQDRIIPVRAFSTDGLRTLKRHEIKPCLIYIDGAHDYSSVLKDFSTALELFPDSTLCGHDYSYGSVKNAIHDVIKTKGGHILEYPVDPKIGVPNDNTMWKYVK